MVFFYGTLIFPAAPVWLEILLLVGLAALLYLLVEAFLYRQRKGKFELLEDQEGFVSDFGRFVIGSEKLERIDPEGKSQLWELESLSGLEYRCDPKWAWGAEFALGFDITDIFSAYEDRMNWFSINIKCPKGEKVPLFVIGQLERREFLQNWVVGLEVRLLHKLGLYSSAEEKARQVLETIQEVFARQDRELTIS